MRFLKEKHSLFLSVRLENKKIRSFLTNHTLEWGKNTAYKFNLYEITKKIINVFISVNNVCNECKNIWPSTSIHIHNMDS